jgi:maltose alpha-D-glucosyltransferase/alpha-amylase
MSYFDNDQKIVVLFYAIVFGIPNIPVIYYGDEIGMNSNIYPENSIYAPMQWDASVNAGFSDCAPSKLYAPVIMDPEYHFSRVNVESQKNEPNSMFNFLKKYLIFRKKYKALKRGEYLRFPLIKKEVVIYIRSCEDETILFLGNLSGRFQCIDIDLSDYSGMYLLDIYIDAIFPQISEIPYRVTLEPYGFYYLKFVIDEWLDD